ncbi:hypothetical protein [Leucobacter sp. NPDC077196]|uniref:hypothetical protein n=1 Tax=Leucobacter sp. NPDC077196 TaxID=3154959 RepID=UPI0034175C73
MAKIRTIKPDFWTDGDIIRLPYEARLFYIGMWNHACDRGHLPDDPFGLKLKILPADPVDGDELVDKLVASGRVTRISLEDDRRYLLIPRFTDHQRIENRWKSRCPACDQADLAETRARFSEERGGSSELGEGREGKGKERKGREGAAPEAPGAPTPTCSSHNGWDHDKPCRACAKDRAAFAAWESAVAADNRRSNRRERQYCEHGLPRHEACERCGDAWPGN